MKTIQDLIRDDPSVAPAFAQAFARQPCWQCHGLGVIGAYGKCQQCNGRGYTVTERRA